MSKLVFCCPVTGYSVTTGVCMKPEAFAKAEIEGGSVSCPHCGNTHRWEKKDIVISASYNRP